MRNLLASQNVRSVARLAGLTASLAAAIVIWAGPAQAQSLARVTIDFPFVAGGSAMEAGTYDIEATRDRVVLRPATTKGAPVAMFVITRLGRHDSDKDAELIFDKIGSTFHLSEFWYPETDGYLLLATQADHDHRVLGGSRPRK